MFDIHRTFHLFNLTMELFDISLYFIPWLFESNLFNEQELYSIFTALFLVNKSINTFITDMSYNTCSSKLLKSLFCPSYAKVIDINTIPNRKNCPKNCVIVNHNMDSRDNYYNISNCKIIVLINCIISEEFVKYKEYDIYFINCKFTILYYNYKFHLTNIGNVYFYNCKNLPTINCNNMLNLELINCHSNYGINCGNVNYINIEDCLFTISSITTTSMYNPSILDISQLKTKIKNNPDFRLKIRLSKNIITCMNLYNVKCDMYIVKNHYSNIYDILDLEYNKNNIFLEYLLNMLNPHKIQINYSTPKLHTRVKRERKNGKTSYIEKIVVELIQDFVEQQYISEINSNFQFPIPNKLNISNKFLCFSQLTTLNMNLCNCHSIISVFSFIDKCKNYLNLQVEIKRSPKSRFYYEVYTYTIANTISFTVAENQFLKNLKIPNYNSLWDIIIRLIKNNIDINNYYFDYNSFDTLQQKLKS